MSEDEARKAGQSEEQEDVEAHRRGANASDEGTAEGDDDVEAHIKRTDAPRKH